MKYDTAELVVLVVEAKENIAELLQRNRTIPKNKRNMADSAHGVKTINNQYINLRVDGRIWNN